jgi:hypothetical protein
MLNHSLPGTMSLFMNTANDGCFHMVIGASLSKFLQRVSHEDATPQLARPEDQQTGSGEPLRIYIMSDP